MSRKQDTEEQTRHPGRSWTWRGELGGSVGDLGITVPLAYALAASCGYPPGRLFLMWGLLYIITAFFYRVPVSVQPLKAMAVVAIAGGHDPVLIGTASAGFGVVFLVLAASGLVPRVRRLFSPALVRGMQLGIALMLARKAVALLQESRLLFGGPELSLAVTLTVAAVSLALLIGGRRLLGILATPLVVAAGILAGWLAGGGPEAGAAAAGPLLTWAPPRMDLLLDAFLLLMLPQLPLTVGNAVIAAEDTCRTCWPDDADRVTVSRLAGSIGLSNLVLGFVGGFPVCHGAGGIAAHARFGGRTGRTTGMLGAVLVAVALIPGGAGLLFLIPVPVLCAMLLMVSWSLARLVLALPGTDERIIAAVVGGMGFFTHNLALALATGWLVQLVLARLPFRFRQPPEEGPRE